jgi:hypothetical protein
VEPAASVWSPADGNCGSGHVDSSEIASDQEQDPGRGKGAWKKPNCEGNC